MDIHYGQYLLNELYDVEIGNEKYEELALIAHNIIGNKNCMIKRYVAVPEWNESTLNYSIDLPCDIVGDVEAVTTLFEDWNFVTNKDSHGDWSSHFIEQYIEGKKEFQNDLYIPGKYIKYNKVGNKLYFERNYGPIHVLYKSEVLDENDLPEVSEKEVLAIAAYIAYWNLYKEGLKTKNPNIILLSLELKKDWLIKCDQARTPDSISQNDMDKILDAKFKWDRKQYGKSYKPL